MQNCHTTSTLGQEMLQLIEKLQFFSLYLFVYFCVPIIILVNSQVPPGATPIN